MLASSGRKISWPVAVDAVKAPITRPALLHEPAVGNRRREHHRERAEPDARNDAPRWRSAPHGACAKPAARMPTAVTESPSTIVFRRPNVCMRPAAKGPGQPEKRDVDGRRKRYGLGAPAHLVLDRQHDDARRRADPGRHQEHDERDHRATTHA